MVRVRSLRQQALIGFAVAALLPAFLLAAVGTVAVRGLSTLARTSARTALEQQVTQGMVIRVSEKAREGDSLFRGVLSQAITLSQFASWESAGARGGADLAFADPLLASIQQSTPGAYRAWLRTPGLIYRAFPDQAGGRSTVVAGARPGLPPELNQPPTFPTWTQPYPDPDSGRLIMTATASAIGPDRQPWAVAGVDMLLSNLFAAVMRPGGDAAQYDILLDQNGQVANLSQEARRDLDLPAAGNPALSDSRQEGIQVLDHTLRFATGPGLTTVQTAGGLRYVAYAPMPVSGWVLGEVVSEAAVTGQITGVETAIRQREALFLGGGAIGGCLLIPLLILLAARRSKSLSRPVSELVEGSRRLAQDLSYRVATTNLPSELADLAHALNNMAASLERSRDEAVRGARLVAEERNRLAREIHDTIAQGLTAVVVQLQTAEDILGDGAPPDALARLARARQVARESLAEARRSVWNLRPGATAGGGLVHALTALKPGMEADGIACVLELDPPSQLDEAAEDGLFRVAQEALANVRKHSKAEHVTITLRQEAGWVRLRIVDDGVGFDPATLTGPQPAGGFGLWAIRTRLSQLGGRVTIESRPGAGTAVTAEVPAGGEHSGAGDQGAGGR